MILRLYAIAVQILLVLFGDRPRAVDAAGYRVVLHRLGPEDGEPWLLLHGLGSTAFSWVSILLALRGECRLLVPELSQIGGTTGPDPALGPRNGPAVLEALLANEGIEGPITVAGISLGGWIALELARRAPERVARLLLLDAAGWEDQDWDRIERQLDLRTLKDVDRFYGLLFRHLPWRFRVSRPGVLKAFRSPAVRFFFEHLSEEDLVDAEELATVTAPTGIVWAEEDGLFHPDVAWAMGEALPDLRYLSIVPDCGHALHWDRPGEVVRRVEEFRRWVPLTAPRPSPRSLPR